LEAFSKLILKESDFAKIHFEIVIYVSKLVSNHYLHSFFLQFKQFSFILTQST